MPVIRSTKKPSRLALASQTESRISVSKPSFPAKPGPAHFLCRKKQVQVLGIAPNACMLMQSESPGDYEWNVVALQQLDDFAKQRFLLLANTGGVEELTGSELSGRQASRLDGRSRCHVVELR